MNAAVPSGNLVVARESNSDIFANEAALIKALSVVRQAAIEPGKKDLIRNLFLSYAGESDLDKRLTLKDSILTEVKQYPALASLVSIASQLDIGHTRPAPSFDVSTIQIPVEKPKVETPLPAEPTATPAPVAPAPVNTDYRARIDEIKHAINGRVGNPVNLISADESVGREYMSALLDAMKKIGQGGAGTTEMTRLENAYKSALNIIETKGVDKAPTAAEKTEPTSAPVTPVSIEPLPVAPPVEEVPPPPPEVIAPPPPATQSEGLYHRPADEIEKLEEEASTPPAQSPHINKFLRVEREEAAPVKSPAPDSRVMPVASVRKISVSKESTLETAELPPVQSEEPLRPLKDSAAALPEKIASMKAEAAKREEDAKRPITDLNAPEVDEGLKQLLSEWVLFKKSGFLGRGPSGINHPLYKKLAGMPMAAVVSGRFEGSAPDIKQHLSDYMTGWRYEQGVAHEMGESFERYLRRVVKQILEKQRKAAKK